MILVKKKVSYDSMDEETLSGYYESIKDVLEYVNEKYQMYKDEESVDKIINMAQLEEMLYVFESMFASVNVENCDFFINLKTLLFGTTKIKAYNTLARNVLIVEFDKRKVYIKDKIYVFEYANVNQGVYLCESNNLEILIIDIKNINNVPVLHFNGDIQAIWTPSFE